MERHRVGKVDGRGNDGSEGDEVNSALVVGDRCP